MSPRWAFFYGVVCGLIVGMVIGAEVLGQNT
jgi:hypothetical protein